MLGSGRPAVNVSQGTMLWKNDGREFLPGTPPQFRSLGGQLLSREVPLALVLVLWAEARTLTPRHVPTPLAPIHYPRVEGGPFCPFSIQTLSLVSHPSPEKIPRRPAERTNHVFQSVWYAGFFFFAQGSCSSF